MATELLKLSSYSTICVYINIFLLSPIRLSIRQSQGFETRDHVFETRDFVRPSFRFSRSPLLSLFLETESIIHSSHNLNDFHFPVTSKPDHDNSAATQILCLSVYHHKSTMRASNRPAQVRPRTNNQKVPHRNVETEAKRSLEMQLKEILLQGSNRDRVESDDQSISSDLVGEITQLMDELQSKVEIVLEGVKSSVENQRRDVESVAMNALLQQAQQVDAFRVNSLPEMKRLVSELKDARALLDGLLTEVDRDLSSLKSMSDDSLRKQLEVSRAQEEEMLRKEVRRLVKAYEQNCF